MTVRPSQASLRWTDAAAQLSMATPHQLPTASTQELGVNILNDLHRQRQTITNARDTLHGADDNIATARRVLATMSRRLMTNKLIMGGVCVSNARPVSLFLCRCFCYLTMSKLCLITCFNLSVLQEFACFSWCDSAFLHWPTTLHLLLTVCTDHPAAALLQTLLSMLCRAQLV